MMSMDWEKVAHHLCSIAANSDDHLLDTGQKATVHELSRRIRAGRRSVLLADEVGMGKTRIAGALIHAVRLAGGRSAIIVPGGLGAQWQAELRCFDPADQTLMPLRSYQRFIEGFMGDGTSMAKLTTLRSQRELPQSTWTNEKVLMISHNFANMRFPRREEEPHLGWRRELLPTVARMVNSRRRNLRRRDNVDYVRATHNLARVVSDAILAFNLPCDLSGDQRWMPGDVYRDSILPLIGYGLGRFNLVVVDEAHKSRGQDSSLSRILGPLTWESEDPFWLAMTATPVEIDARQWIDTFERVHAFNDAAETTALQEAIKNYCDIVARLQTEELDDDLAASFDTTAKAFEAALDPHVLRRDKRDDAEYAKFFEEHGDYRDVADLSVSPESSVECFTHDWLRRFCAAEAASLLPQNNPRIKRIRLSIAQGHSLDVVANNLQSQDLNSGEGAEIEQGAEDLSSSDTKSASADFWMEALGGQVPDIYGHPALLAAAQQIESFTANGEKVLVFGRYIKPLRALSRYIHARAMLRALQAKTRWPSSKIPDNEAVVAALRDPMFRTLGSLDNVKQFLAAQYMDWRAARRRELTALHAEIARLAASDNDAHLLARLLGHSNGGQDLRQDTARLFEALEVYQDNPSATWTGKTILDAFKAMLTEHWEGDETSPTPKKIAERLEQHLEDFAGWEGSFARFMYGGTRQQARRNLQSAFNRPNANPRVLLAQSRVGREGLNLHEECRRIVLLHAEWNPAIVEQQIGRVDRKNSRWLKDYRAYQQGQAPRISIHPVVVRGTYDDRNWQVLKSRWRSLRAQLHGDVLPHLWNGAVSDTKRQALIERVRASTPNFSPLRSRDLTPHGGGIAEEN
ncbi:DEAD/DEAH box helicase [Paracoccus marcusii]|uniref:DEAD/DEAH box helicase n=1 Tax=Paracoccus marcusii TaxID=59779 RepID=UPI0032652668